MSTPHALVVCIGNELVADDAVGHAVFKQLQQVDLPEGTRLEYCGVGGIALLELLEEQDRLMIVVDAVQFGAPPGTVRVWSWDELPCPGAGCSISAHSIGLKDTIAIGQTLYPERMPQRILLVGVEGCCFNELGAAMSPAVSTNIPAAVAAVLNELS